jgi:hypothetical protein
VTQLPAWCSRQRFINSSIEARCSSGAKSFHFVNVLKVSPHEVVTEVAFDGLHQLNFIGSSSYVI